MWWSFLTLLNLKVSVGGQSSHRNRTDICESTGDEMGMELLKLSSWLMDSINSAQHHSS